MKKGIKNQTVYTKENYLLFNRVHYKKNLGKKKWLFLSFILLTLPLIVFYLFNGTSASIWIIVFFSMMDIFLYLESFTNYLPDLHTRHMLKKEAELENLVNQYTFYEDYFILENSYGKIKTEYDKLCQVIDTEENIYLYQTKVSAFLVEKQNFSEKDLLKLEEKLKEKLGKKYYTV